MSTEARNPRSIGLDRMDAASIVRLMNEEEYWVLRALEDAEPAMAVASERLARAYQEGGRTVFVGAGHSGRIALAGAAVMPGTFGVPHDRFLTLIAGGPASYLGVPDDAEDDEHAAIEGANALKLTRKDVMVAIGASGKTPFTLAAMRHAKAKGLWTCAVVCTKGAKMLEFADHAIVIETGPEVLTGATHLKAGTAHKLVLNRITLAAMVLSGKVKENLMVDVKATNAKQRERCVRIVRELTTATEGEAHAVLERVHWSVRAALEAIEEPAVQVGGW